MQVHQLATREIKDSEKEKKEKLLTFCNIYFNLFIPDLLLLSHQPIGQVHSLPPPMDQSALKHFPKQVTQQRFSYQCLEGVWST